MSTYLAGKMPAPQEFYDLTLYLIRAENAVQNYLFPILWKGYGWGVFFELELLYE
jgi:hypothetical protein